MINEDQDGKLKAPHMTHADEGHTQSTQNSHIARKDLHCNKVNGYYPHYHQNKTNGTRAGLNPRNKIEPTPSDMLSQDTRFVL